MSQSTCIEKEGFFVEIVRKFAKIADFQKSTYEPTQLLVNKRKSRPNGRLFKNGERAGT